MFFLEIMSIIDLLLFYYYFYKILHSFQWVLYCLFFLLFTVSISPLIPPSIRLCSFIPSFPPLPHLLAHPPRRSSPPVKISTFHPPHLGIPPEGRLSSSSASPCLLFALSHSPDFLILSITWVLTCTKKTHPPQIHTPLSFVNTVSSNGKKVPYLPCHPLMLLYDKSNHSGVGSASALNMTSSIKESSQNYSNNS